MNKNKKRVTLAILIFLALLFTSNTTTVYAVKDGTGADEIFNIIGVVKPSNWNTMTRSERFAYLENLGAYPQSGDKYQGEIDIERYFETLGIEEPEGWTNLSTQERVDFIDSLKESQKESEEKDLAEIVNTKGGGGKEYNLPLIGTLLILLYLGSLALVKKGKVKLVTQRRFWNVLLGTFFLSTATLGILLVIRISYGVNVPLPFNMLFWHVETGIAFSFIAIFHALWHMYYFKLMFKK
ncbi:hypothetical protein JXA63_03540 [Candidatus Woesebacteria bacterium]|nr:hypothetical protein [Candidatus Woesebacteria bacterium]